VTDEKASEPLDRPTTPAIPLLEALLCAECDAIVQSPAPACPSCLSTVLQPLTTWVPAKSRPEEAP
jgi:hypothetical protein